jgi:hypothetical protein
MKKVILKLIYASVKNDKFWRFLTRTLYPLASILKHKRQEFELQQRLGADPELKSIFSGKKVLNGPFKGLKYPSDESFGSALYPKFLGSYENEIIPIVEEVCNKEYANVLDIGCAEGYYAIGLALRMPKAMIHAYDTKAQARDLCTKMAEYNNVADRVITKTFCSADTLINFYFTGRGLIICDCEGYEKQLFTDASVKNLTYCDLIIETHDNLDPTISYYLQDLFSKSHSLTVVTSMDDLQKLKHSHFPELDHLDIYTKKLIIEEERGVVQEWHYYKALI